MNNIVVSTWDKTSAVLVIVGMLLVAPSAHAQPVAAELVRRLPIADGYATTETNATSYSRALVTEGRFQFAAFYEPLANGGAVVVARRRIGSDEWQTFRTEQVANDLGDAHDVVALGLSGDGHLHMAWGMHSDRPRYTRSLLPVLNDDVIEFNDDTSWPTSVSAGVTYPEFVRTSSGDLLLLYRTGVSGGGDTQLDRYERHRGNWGIVHRPLVAGDDPDDDLPDVNAYTNRFVIDGAGILHLTFTLRTGLDSAQAQGFQTNHHLYYARSDNVGREWTRLDGTKYELPITEQTAGRVVDIPEGSSLINQTGMAVDHDSYPVVATYWAPEAASGNHTRQYMLVWYDGAAWQTAAITNYPPPESERGPITEPMLHDLRTRMARPAVALHHESGGDRVLVVFSDYHRDGVITVAHSMDRRNWEFVDLTDEPAGFWEPTFDQVRWRRDGILSMLYQPSGLGEENAPVEVLEWDARAYFRGQ